MRIFSSARERRLWLWFAVVQTAIYLTLGRAPALAAMLRERDELAGALFFILFVSLTVVAVLFVRSRPGGVEIAVGIGIAIVFVSAWLRIGLLEERTHLFEYGLIGALLHEALIERQANGRRVPAPAVLALLIALLLGWIDEGIQAILPNRVYDIRDVAFNALAAMGVIAARRLLQLVRRRR